MPVKKIAHKVNHVALVIDRSGSMKVHQAELLKVADAFVAGLKKTSDQLGHVTRISVYAFDHVVDNLVWEMDVKHLPSLADRYTVDNGATALLEASVVSIDEMVSEISEKHGEHLFLHVVLTDGDENGSGTSQLGRAHHNQFQYRHILNDWKAKLADRLKMVNGRTNWTSGIMVPSITAKQTAVEYGFLPGNVQIWDTRSSTGIEEAVSSIEAAASNLLRSHDRGVSRTSNLWAVGQDLDVATVKSVLKPLDGTKYRLLDIKSEDHEKEIRPFIQERKITYKPGMAYYQLGARVTVQASKNVAVLDTSGKVDLLYTGPDALRLVFGDENVGSDGKLIKSLSVKAGHNKDLKVFVQSKSVNRHLKYMGDGTKLVVML